MKLRHLIEQYVTVRIADSSEAVAVVNHFPVSGARGA
jgi:hypothetical protein